MKFNQDIVPSNLDDAVDTLYNGLCDESIEFITENEYITTHHSLGRYIRNSWSLWDKETILVKWFEENYGITHADDISSVILNALWSKVRKVEPRTEDLVDKCKKHWEMYGE